VWQDIAVAIVFWAIDASLRRPRWLWILYARSPLWVVINIPVIATLGSPLTPTMIRAAGAALGNSMQSALTLPSVLKMCAVAAVADGRPRLLSGFRARVAHGLCRPRLLDCRGGRRQPARRWTPTACIAMRDRAARHGHASSSAADTPMRPRRTFRSSPFGERRGEDLTQYRGRAKGFNVLLVALESTAARYLKPYGAQTTRRRR
jgi:hypothetical protein